jgi:peroxiredoxin
LKRRHFHLGAVALSAALALPAFAQAPVVPAKKPAPAAVPKVAPYAIKGVDVYGKAINLKDHVGKVVLVSFFTVDCIKCINDLRLMREFYGDNKKRGYVNIAINLDSDREALFEYMELLRKTMPADRIFPIAWRDAKGHADNFGVTKSMPTHFLLDREHKLVMRRDGVFKADDWDELWTSLEE